MESASHTSDESVYHSCSENSAWDSAWDSDQEAADEEPHWTPASSAFLGATNTALLFSDSETLRVLVCINAARIILAEITSSARKLGSLRPFKGEAILKRILAICTEWKETTDEEFGTIMALPIFQSSLGLLRSERRFCSDRNIGGLIAQLQDESSAAIVTGQNDALTIIGVSSDPCGKPSSYIVFNPQCRASTDLGGASLRIFPTVEETVGHVYNITAIHRGVQSNSPRHMYSGYILVPQADTISPRYEIASQYQVNTRLLQETLKLKAVKARELSSRSEVGALQSRTELELQGERGAFTRRDAILAEIVALKVDLDDVHAITAAVLEIHLNPENTMANIETDSEKLGQVSGSGEAAPKQESLSDDTSPTDSRRSEISTLPTSPETLWNAAAEGDTSQKATIWTGEEKGIQETQSLQAQMAEEAMSLGLARKLLEEDELERANSSLECPCCLDKCHKNFMVEMELCDHLACKTCMQEYIKGQGRDEPLGPVFCPVCTEDQPNRGSERSDPPNFASTQTP